MRKMALQRLPYASQAGISSHSFCQNISAWRLPSGNPGSKDAQSALISDGARVRLLTNGLVQSRAKLGTGNTAKSSAPGLLLCLSSVIIIAFATLCSPLPVVPANMNTHIPSQPILQYTMCFCRVSSHFPLYTVNRPRRGVCTALWHEVFCSNANTPEHGHSQRYDPVLMRRGHNKIPLDLSRGMAP